MFFCRGQALFFLATLSCCFSVSSMQNVNFYKVYTFLPGTGTGCTGILLPIPIIEYQAIKLSTFIVNYYQIPSTVTNYLHNNINQLLKELSVKGTK